MNWKKLFSALGYLALFILFVVLAGGLLFMTLQDKFRKDDMKVGSIYQLDDPVFPSEFVVKGEKEGNIHGDLTIFLPEGVSPVTAEVQRFKDTQNRIENCQFTISYPLDGNMVNMLWDKCPNVNYTYVYIDNIILKPTQ